MSAPLRLALAQVDTTVGDLAANERRIVAAIEEAAARDAALVLLPELALTGYPPEDLLLKERFFLDTRAALERVAQRTRGPVALVGFPELGDDAHNALAVLADGAVRAVYRKVHLPNYGVFDEQRYFAPGPGGALIEVAGHLIGLTICEDVWTPGPPASEEALAGAALIVNASASPYFVGKGDQRERMLVQRARDNLAAVAFCNLVGGQDELVFDGESLVIDHEGTIIARARQFDEELLVAAVDLRAARGARLRDTRLRPIARGQGERAVPTLARLEPSGGRAERVSGSVAPRLGEVVEAHAALVRGLRDYVNKNGFERTVLGLSGGIDSAVTAAIAVAALGAARVSTVVMPSPYSSDATQGDARELAKSLGVDQLELEIAPVMEAYERLLAQAFAERDPDITEENLQARIRGNLLMALSNKFGWLVLTTGNKSELSVGYSTLYGDSAGGFAVIKDCPKTLVYALAAWINEDAGTDLIPRAIVDRAPSAELRPDQLDEDSLPAYPALDPILAGYVEGDLGRDELVNRGADPDDVDRILTLVDRAEYKRRQHPPGIKITTKAFGRDRRMPITNRYRG